MHAFWGRFVRLHYLFDLIFLLVYKEGEFSGGV
jgi:hypothetical protein